MMMMPHERTPNQPAPTRAPAPDRSPFVQGYFRDRVRGPSGAVREYGWRENLVVDRGRQLLAAFIKGEDVAGIAGLWVGRGHPSWDQTPPEPPQPGHIQLVDSEPFSVAVTSDDIVFLDATSNPSDAPSHRIQVTITLAPGVPPAPGGGAYPLREFGLFGTVNESEFMFDYVRHPVIHKGPDDTLERVIRLIF